MAGFDPDAYLKQESAPQGEGFNPDAYLENEQKAAFENNAKLVAQAPKKTVAQSMLVGGRQGALMGYAPQIEAMIEPVTAKVFDALNNTNMSGELPGYVERRDAASKRMNEYKKDNPTAFAAGEIGGTIATSIIPGGMAGKAVGNLSKVQKMGKVGQNIAKAAGTGAAIGALQNPGDIEGELNPLQAWDRAKNAIVGAGTGAITQGALEAGAGAVNITKDLAKRGAAVIKENLPTMKPNAAEIIASARRQGITVTPSMILDGEKFQALESSLAKSPSLLNRVGKQISQNKDAIENKVDDVLDESSGLSAFETGEKVKKSIQQTFNNRTAPVSKQFDDIAASTKNIGVSQKGVDRVAQNIDKIDEVALYQGTGAGAETIANTYKKVLSNVKTVDQLKTVRTQMQAQLREMPSGPERNALSAMLDKVSRLESRNIERAAILAQREATGARMNAKGLYSKTNQQKLAQADIEGADIAKQLIGDLKSARTGYAGIQNDARAIGKAAGMKVKNAQGLDEALEKMRPEDITKRFFNTGDERLLTFMQQKFPKEFDELRRFKLSQIQGKSKSATSGDSLPGGFLQQMKDLSPSVRKMVLGSDKKVSDASDVKEIYQAMSQYRNFNPSGTGQANSYMSPITSTLTDLPRYALYKGMANNTVRGAMDKVANAASKMKDVNTTSRIGSLAGRASAAGSDFVENPAISDPRILDMVSQNPAMIDQVQDPRLKKALQERMHQQEPKKYKGESAWMANGYKNLLANDTTGLLQNEAVIQDLMNTNEGAQLLMLASEAKPGSKAFESVMSKIKSKYQGAK